MSALVSVLKTPTNVDLAVFTIPAVFLLLWSSGFIAAKIGLSHADTLTFLAIRYSVVTVLMGLVAVIMRAPWPGSRTEFLHIAIAGILHQAIYFGSVWLAMGMGVGAGVAALIVCLQPVLTALLVGPLLGEKVFPRQWCGLFLGFSGVALVVAHKLEHGLGNVIGMTWAFIGLFAITFGMLYQKKFCADMDPRTGSGIQFFVSALFIAPLALIFEEGQIDWNFEFIGSLIYVAVFLSLISMVLLAIMIRKGEASRVSSLFFLVPPVAALLAWVILDEPFGLTALGGMALATAGVALVMMPRKSVAG